MKALVMIDRQLSDYWSGKAASATDLSEIQGLVDDLIAYVQGADIEDPQLQAAILLYLRRVADTLSTYRLVGSRPTREAVFNLAGEVADLLEKSGISEVQKTELRDRMRTLLRRTNTVCTTAVLVVATPQAMITAGHVVASGAHMLLP
jgi:hypothetical protein